MVLVLEVHPCAADVVCHVLRRRHRGKVRNAGTLFPDVPLLVHVRVDQHLDSLMQQAAQHRAESSTRPAAWMCAQSTIAAEAQETSNEPVLYQSMHRQCVWAACMVPTYGPMSSPMSSPRSCRRCLFWPCRPWSAR